MENAPSLSNKTHEIRRDNPSHPGACVPISGAGLRKGIQCAQGRREAGGVLDGLHVGLPAEGGSVSDGGVVLGRCWGGCGLVV